MPVLLVTGYLFDSSGRLAPCRAAALAAGAGVAVGGGPAVRPSSGAAVRAVPLWRLAQAQRCVAGVAPLPRAGGSGGRTTGGSTRSGAAVCRSPRPLGARAPTRRACVAPRPCCCGPGVAPGRVWPCPPPSLLAAVPAARGCPAGGATRRRPTSLLPRGGGPATDPAGSAASFVCSRSRSPLPLADDPPAALGAALHRGGDGAAVVHVQNCLLFLAGAPVAADAPCCRAAPSPDDGGGGTRVYTPRR